MRTLFIAYPLEDNNSTNWRVPVFTIWNLIFTLLLIYIPFKSRNCNVKPWPTLSTVIKIKSECLLVHRYRCHNLALKYKKGFCWLQKHYVESLNKYIFLNNFVSQLFNNKISALKSEIDNKLNISIRRVIENIKSLENITILTNFITWIFLISRKMENYPSITGDVSTIKSKISF